MLKSSHIPVLQYKFGGFVRIWSTALA